MEKYTLLIRIINAQNIYMKKLFAWLGMARFLRTPITLRINLSALLEVQNGHYNAVCTGRALNNIINALGEKINAF